MARLSTLFIRIEYAERESLMAVLRSFTRDDLPDFDQEDGRITSDGDEKRDLFEIHEAREISK